MKRRRSNSSAGDNKNNVIAFAQSVALPVDTPVVRMRDQYTATDTAVAQPFERPVLPWSTPISLANAGKRALPPDTSLVVTTRDPLCAYIYEDKNPALLSTTYVWSVGRQGNTDVLDWTVQPGDSFTPDLMGARNIAGRAFHGDFLWARKFNGKNMIYCDAPNTPDAQNIITVTTNTTITATDFIAVSLYRLNEGDEIKVGTQILNPVGPGAVAATFQIPARDYYWITVTMTAQSTTPAVSLNIRNANQCAMFCHRSLPDLDDHSDEVTRLHILGASMRAQNTANDQFKGGSVVADQVEPTTIWTAYARPTISDGFEVLSGQRGQDIRNLENGLYGFIKPVEEDDFNYLDLFRFDSSGNVCHRGKFDSDACPYIIMILRAGGTTDSADPSRSIQLHFNFNVEFETKDTWTAVGPAMISISDAGKAIGIIATMKQFFENPIHWEKILATIGTVARLATPLLALIPHPYAKAAAAASAAIGSAL